MTSDSKTLTLSYQQLRVVERALQLREAKLLKSFSPNAEAVGQRLDAVDELLSVFRAAIREISAANKATRALCEHGQPVAECGADE